MEESIDTAVLPTRTISITDWDSSMEKAPLLPDAPINEIVWKAMAEVNQMRPPPVSAGGIRPWPGDRDIYGFMWAGVPFMRNYRRHQGGWIVSDNNHRCELRLCPAQPGCETQFGFCPVRLDRFEEVAVKHLGPLGTWKVTDLDVGTGSRSLFRLDKVVTAVVTLGDVDNMSEEAQSFRDLLGTTLLSVFIKDMLRNCYQDKSPRSILTGRDEDYRRAVQLVCEQLHPNLMTDRSQKGIELIRSVVGLGHHSDWGMHFLWPSAFNIVMPQRIFDALDENFQKGIPPIVPQYATTSTWMFNYGLSNPCTGLSFENVARVRPAGSKAIGGVFNTFNFDVPGPVSYWPSTRNPPEGWIDTFLGCIQGLGKQSLPLDTTEKTDLALSIARQIPVMISQNQGSASQYPQRFARVIGERNEGYITSLTVQECNETGRAVEAATPENPSVATTRDSPPSGSGQDSPQESVSRILRECDVCSSTCSLDSATVITEDLVRCEECDRWMCGVCRRRCTECEIAMCAGCAEDHECGEE